MACRQDRQQQQLGGDGSIAVLSTLAPSHTALEKGRPVGTVLKEAPLGGSMERS